MTETEKNLENQGGLPEGGETKPNRRVKFTRQVRSYLTSFQRLAIHRHLWFTTVPL